MRFSARYVKDYFWKSRLRSIFFWVIAVVLVLMAAFGFSYYFCQNTVIMENSMEPTLHAGETVLINTLGIKIIEPDRGDIIVFRTTSDEEGSLHIKRVIGLPGETVQIIEGQVYIDGVPYLEGEDFPSMDNPGLAEDPITLDDDEYFVLGDNRNSSEDSRHLEIGNVKKDNIVGELWFVTAPFSNFGFLSD